MKEVELAIVGGGPAGLSAARVAAQAKAGVLLIDDGQRLGGQLVKQTHKFFGSKGQYASTRGIEIARILVKGLEGFSDLEVWLNSTAVGYYPDGVLAVLQGEKLLRVKPARLIVATGASEKMLAFANNDLPGVYGAGAVQTLMNVYGVLPGRRALMVGAGNIGLIVGYQLMQAGVKVEAVVEAMPGIGGYWVHAAKIRRMGVPILTSHTILRAEGEEWVEGAIICPLAKGFKPIEAAQRRLEVDTICLAVGLSPLSELLWQAGCKMEYISQVGGYVALRREDMETTVKGVYVAGDSAGVEEASTAMVEGRIAGLAAALSLGCRVEDADGLKRELREELEMLRRGPVGEKIREGIKRVLIGRLEISKNPQPRR